MATSSSDIFEFLSQNADRFATDIADPFGSSDELLAAVDPILQVAERLLQYEQRLDELERRKAADGELPADDEQFVLDTIGQNADDATEFVRLTLDLFNRYEEAGSLASRVRVTAESLGGLEVPAAELLDEEYLQANGQLWSDRGYDRGVLDWALGYFPVADMTLSAAADGRLVLSGLGRQAALAEFNPSPLPLQDPSAFVSGGYLLVGPSADAIIDGVSTKSPYGAILAMGREVEGRFRQRAEVTQENGGVVIYQTGFIPAAVLIVGLILLLLSIVVGILCAVGIIGSAWVCYVALAVFAIVMLAGCLSGIALCSLVIAGAEIPIPALAATGASAVQYSYYEPAG